MVLENDNILCGSRGVGQHCVATVPVNEGGVLPDIGVVDGVVVVRDLWGVEATIDRSL